MTYDAKKAAELVAMAMEDDERMTPGPWDAERGSTVARISCARMAPLATFGVEQDEPDDDDRANCDAIARTRNNLRALAEQLAAAMERIDYLEDYRRENSGLITKINDAVNRAGIHCAVYYWEAIDMIAADRDRLRAVCSSFVDTVEHAVRCKAQERSGGQHVSYHGDFASAPPSTMSRLEWWCREFHNAATKAPPP